MSGLFIGVKRIIVVDSSEFAYAELELDAHSMLVAEGNVGKSSLINAIRLFFLPECSMANQAINFGFSDSHGDMYSSEATFNHYFPSRYSFLILEYEKRLYDGPHACQIISASGSGRLKLERMFTQLPYEQLRGLFWQEGGDQDGIGQRIENLSKKGVYDFIHKHDKLCELVKEPSKTASLLYEDQLQLSRYTLFPLKDKTPQSINSLRALIKLLFVASNKNKKPFTDAIANIIESTKKNTQDQLGFDIAEFKARHESLKQQENELTQVVNMQKVFEQIQDKKRQFEDYLVILKDVKPALSWLQHHLVHLQKELVELADKNSLAIAKYDKAKTNERKSSDALRDEKNTIKHKQNELKQHQHILNKVRAIQNEFPGQENAFIVEALKADLSEKQRDLDVIQGNISRDVAIADIDNQLTVLEKQKKVLISAIENAQYSLEAQLPKGQLDWLHSINPQLANATLEQKMSANQRQAFDDFADLFEQKAIHFEFYDIQLPVNAYSKVNREAKLEQIEQEIAALNKQKMSLSRQESSPLHTSQNIQQLEKSIQLNIQDMEALKDADYVQRRSDIVLSELDIAQTNMVALEKTLQAAMKNLDDAALTKQKASEAHLACKQSIEEQQQFEKRLRDFATLHQKWLLILDAKEEFSGIVNDQAIHLFETSARNLTDLQISLVSQLRRFIDANIIDDKHGLKGDAPFWHEIDACINDVAEIYGNLDTQRDLLGKQIEEHNQTIGTKKEIIVHNYRMIVAFEKDINQAFAGITINNVSKVEFEVGINKQFEALVNEFAETNLYSNQMQSDDFYQRLVAFAERFFSKGDTFTITMDRIIESFEPRIQLQNKIATEDKKQSNSTNALIKIKLVQLLLKRLLANDCETAFVIVHDEIANIDIGQFDWWLHDLSKSGFNLMAAGTHSTSPELQAKIGRRHVMDALTTALPYHKERNRVHWQGAELFSSKEGLQNLEQVELL